jgi:hypothetical protein
MPRVAISRNTYERLKDATLEDGQLEVEGFVGFRKDGTVTLELSDHRLARLKKWAPDVDYAINMALDAYFYERRPTLH